MSVQPVDWVGHRLQHAKQTYRRKRRDWIAWRYGLREGTRTLRVDGVAVDYRVGNYKEYWRAVGQMSEPELVEAIATTVGPGVTFWDVGAAVGTYSCLAAVAGAEVLAFEPVPENAHRIVENAACNDVEEAVTVHPVALSDTDGTVPFRPSGRRVGEGTHRVDAAAHDMRVPAERGVGIQPAPDVLKVDVEGHEVAVLAGLDTHLATVRAAFIEVHPQHGVDVAAIRERLETAGLGVERMDMGTSRSETFLRGVRG